MSLVGRRYAKALFDLAQLSGKTDIVGKGLNEAANTFAESTDFKQIVESAVVNRDQRRKIVESIAIKAGWDKLVVNTLKLLSDRGRLIIVADVNAAYRTLLEQASGRVRAEVTTAVRMSAAYMDQLRAALEAATGKKVIMETKEDPAIIGGVIAKVGDRVFDGSIQTSLSELSNKLRVNQR